jgi:hypothetical protein
MSMEARPEAAGLGCSLGAIKPVKAAAMDEKAWTDSKKRISPFALWTNWLRTHCWQSSDGHRKGKMHSLGDGSLIIQTKQDQGSSKKKLTKGQWVASTTSRCLPQHQAKDGAVA